MSRVLHSVAMAGKVDEIGRSHLLRSDGQEDLCFGLWHPSDGRTRKSALISRLILPEPGDREVHGNVSFQPAFFERAMAEATACGAALALLHSHPAGSHWQGMSKDDVETESGMTGAVFGATDLPLVGLTLAGDGSWSARFWIRTAPRTFQRYDCATVRVVSDDLRVTFCDQLAPSPAANGQQIRTVSSWGRRPKLILRGCALVLLVLAALAR